MVDTCVGPSELHLKKELGALQKSHILCDPDTHTSWKSPLNYSNDNSEDKEGMNNSSGSFEVHPEFEKRRKKVYLYNWRHHSTKSSDSGFQLDEDNKLPFIQDIPDEVMNDSLKLESWSDIDLRDLWNSSGMEGKDLGSLVGTVRKSSTGVSLRKRNNRKSTLRACGPSGDSGHYCSGELQQSKFKSTEKLGGCPHCSSSIISGSNSSKLLKSGRWEGSPYSCTPASNSLNNRQDKTWDRILESCYSDNVDYNKNQRCGYSRNWSKRSKQACLRSCSPSLSDTPRRMVRRILCGSGVVQNKRNPSEAPKNTYIPQSSQGMPLLVNSFDGVKSSEDSDTDKLPTNFEELELESISRLDGRRWSSCTSQDGVELDLLEGFNSHMVEEKCLSQKYRPRFFDEIVCQNIIIQSLKNAVLKGRIAPAYLFQGPSGIGKTSTARVFAAALNCLSTEENRPCGLCTECNKYAIGDKSSIIEVNATDEKVLGRIKLLLKRRVIGTTSSRYIVFVIDECHMLSRKSWSALVKFLEEPRSRIVFIFIAIDPDSLPRAVVSRCQKYIFTKIKDVDIFSRLRKISSEENLDVDLDALNLITLTSDGSLRDAETVLDQLSLLGKRITTALVNDFVGVVPEEKLLDLLELALSSDSAETIRRSRDLMESGVNPVALMSQLAGLIMDIIAGSYRLPESRFSSTDLVGQSLTEAEMRKLQEALMILSNAERQLRLSSESSTWFTAALLQIGASHTPQNTPSQASSRQSMLRLNEGASGRTRGTPSSENVSNHSLTFRESNSASNPGVTSGRRSVSAARRSVDYIGNYDDATTVMDRKCVSVDKLDAIWRRCVEKCNSERLRLFLFAHGKLVSITESKGILIAYIGFRDNDIKCRAERFLSTITDSIAVVLNCNVVVRIGVMPEKYLQTIMSSSNSPSNQSTEIIQDLDTVRQLEHSTTRGSSNMPRKSVDYFEHELQKTSRTAIDEQRLESALLQAAVNAEAPSTNYSEQDSSTQNQMKSLQDISISFKHWGDGDRDEIEEVESLSYSKEKVGGRVEGYRHALSHSSSFRANFDQESLGYDSGTAQYGFCCWKTIRSNKGKVKESGKHVRSKGAGECFGQC